MNLISWMTGARKGEVSRAIYSFMALFLLLISYYLVKPMRSSYYLKEFDADLMAYFFLVIPVISLAITRLFNYFYGRVPKFKLIFLTYAVVITCKLAFLALLPTGGKIITLIFYFWAAVYFLLSISILWGCISTIFNSEAGERTFAFIAFGGMSGSFIGSLLSDWLAESSIKDYVLLLSALSMGAVLIFLALAVRQTPDFQDEQGKLAPQGQHTFFRDFLAIWDHRYIRAIGVMVFALAFMNTVVEFKSHKIIDEQMAQQAYLEHFSVFNQALCQQQACQAGVGSRPLSAPGFELFFHLKSTAEDQQTNTVQAFVKTHQLNFESSALLSQYTRYRETLEGQTRGFFSRVQKWTNLLGTILLLLVARPLFRLAGVNRVVLLLPVFFMAVGLLLFFPVELGLMAGILIGTGTLNYSLNKTAKELLYTESDNEARFRFKPLIEGPVLRLGDVSAAAGKILFLDVLSLPALQADWALLGCGLLITSWWLVSVWYAGGHYQARKADQALQPAVAT